MIDRVLNNRYRVTERVGIGGMAEVYKAQDQTLGRTVAVKVMLPQYAADPDFTVRFRQEAASAANLSSPYIVNVYDWGQDNGTYYIVMEFVRGIDLKSAIQQRGAINQRKVAEIGSQVCQALSVAHNQDIIHRDIKPQNIMVQPDGNVKVMDFGIARAKNSVMQQTSSVLGTAHYISPEQAQGKELSGTSDIYSLGCVLYEAATGQLPFDGPDAVSVAMQQVQEPPIPPSQVNPSINPDLEAIILKAMDKSPYNRFQTAREMKTALDDFLMGRPVDIDGVGTASGNSTAATSVINTNIPVISPYNNGAGGTAVMPAVDDDGYGRGGTYNNRQWRDPYNPEPRRRVGPIIAGIIVALLAIAGIAFAVTTFMGSTTEVPDLTGKTQAEAEKELDAAELDLGKVDSEYSDTVEAGLVISQDPTGGSSAKKDSKVNIVLSLGVEQGSVPDLSGKNAQEAQKAIEDAGFKAEFGGNEPSDVDKDLVSRQEPAAGSDAAKGDTVTYWISSGPEKIDVPKVIGYSEEEATQILVDAGFKVTSSKDYSSEYAEGTVMDQSPNGGQLDAGSFVEIVISAGQQSYEIPSVVGLSEAEALSTLEYYGFKNVSVEGYEHSSDVAEGEVIRQTASGSTTDLSTYVGLTVSSGPSIIDELFPPDDNGGNGNTDDSGNGGNTDDSGNGEGGNTDDSGNTDDGGTESGDGGETGEATTTTA